MGSFSTTGPLVGETADLRNDEPVSPILWDMFREGGWQYLLNPQEGNGSVLCYDCTEGGIALLLTHMYRHVTLIHASKDHLERIRRRVSLEGVTAIRYQVVREASDFRTLADSPYTGFVIHDFEATVFRRGKGDGERPVLHELLAGAREVLSPDGFVYISMRNRLSYSILRDGWSNPIYRRCMTSMSAKRALTSAGFGDVQAHPFILEGPYVSELVPEGGYLAAKGGFSLVEKFKQIALGRRGSRYFAAGYGLVARKDALPFRSTLERLLNGHAEYGLPIPPGRLELKRYLVLNWGKVILSVGSKLSKYGEYVLVLTRERRPTFHRRREAETLRALAERKLSQGDRIPRFLGEYPVDGAACFVMRTIPGISIDRPGPGLEALTGQAVGFICVFHAETLNRVKIDEQAYARLFGDLFRKATARYAPLAPELAQLERLVRAGIIGTELPIVWMHGDFKIENMIFSETEKELRGVIDWEHSVECGLPMLDILYLLTYNRALCAAGDLLPAIRSLIVRGPSEFERRMLARYAGHVPVEASLEKILQAMFFVHHIGVRFKYIFESELVVSGLREMLSLLAGALHRAEPESRGTRT